MTLEKVNKIVNVKLNKKEFKQTVQMYLSTLGVLCTENSDFIIQSTIKDDRLDWIEITNCIAKPLEKKE